MRLTEKYNCEDYAYCVPIEEHILNISYDNFCYGNIIEKLGQLEDIEEELGIDLLTLFKALMNGIWVKTKYGISQHFTVSLRKWLQTNTYCLYYRPYTHVWFKNYGKTWALTREELE